MAPRRIPEETVDKNTAVRIMIDKTELIPDIKHLGEELKVKKIEPLPAKPAVQQEQQAVPDEKSRPETKTIEKLLSQEITPDKPIELLGPQEEAALRYQDMVKRKIQEQKKYPAWAEKRGIEGASRLVFTVLADGTAKGISIIYSSGSFTLDDEAIATVKRASPFNPIPAQINRTKLTMEITIAFRLE
ncbi:MAG: hypothetical protein A3G38_03780 [Omnitrophica WOR_2 bacterium RIFCSPLOWO2_12_FULL_51_8]|nr:MAG: hypothetical protein A3G38_03780 [Omnitrophica WOR_2 bacterium RIFCSPLOWO2_12_FULL_51_8]